MSNSSASACEYVFAVTARLRCPTCSPMRPEDAAEVQEALRTSVRRWFRRTTGRRPAVLPVVLEL